MLLAEMYTQSPVLDQPEDVLIGQMLYNASIEYDFVKLGTKTAFDVAGVDKDAAGIVTEIALAPHKLKSDELYKQVAGLFDKEGWNGKNMTGITDFEGRNEG